MIELISAEKVDKISETDVSLPEKVVSNQEKFQIPWQIGTCMPRTRHLAGVVPSPRAIRFIVTCKLSTSRHVVKLLVVELLLLFVFFCFHNRNV